MHQHDNQCGCGADHHDHHSTEHNQCGCGSHTHEQGQSHEHSKQCGCGAVHDTAVHVHNHEHDEHCECGHDHVPLPTPDGLTNMQVDILLALRQRQCLPIACFSLAKAGDDERRAVALAPVYLGSPDDTMAQVKQVGAELKALENMDLLTLDYDMPIQRYGYEEYKASALFAYFTDTVREAAAKPDATFDTPVLELGSMALTDNGEDMVDALIAQADK